jgi:SAM-dependent methyltransferase
MTADHGLAQIVGGHRPPLPAANFDRVAAAYGILERIAFGDALQRARTAFLDHTIGSSRVLVVGEGNGRFLAELLRIANPDTEIDCVDSSAEMMRLAQRRIKPFVIPSGVKGSRGSYLCRSATGSLDSARDNWLGERIRFHHADFLAWQPERGDYDVIVTHFFLDCFDREQLPNVIDKITALGAPGARWLISDFSLPPRGFRRWHARAWLKVMYSFFHLVSNLETNELVPFASLLREHRFHLRSLRAWRYDLIRAQLWQR